MENMTPIEINNMLEQINFLHLMTMRQESKKHIIHILRNWNTVKHMRKLIEKNK